MCKQKKKYRIGMWLTSDLIILSKNINTFDDFVNYVYDRIPPNTNVHTIMVIVQCLRNTH